MKSLLLIDIQNDFLPGGALAVQQGDEILPVANALLSQYELVVATQDWHPADHQSFAGQHPGMEVGQQVQLAGLDQILWPEHCVQGSRGAEFSAQLNQEAIQRVIRKGTDPLIDSYSGFFDNARRKETELGSYLRSQQVDEVHLVGLATDYCVKFTALDAVDLGFRTVLLSKGIRGVELNLGDCQRAVDEMRSRGVEVR
ncbi:MAG: nicotinamidase/pyrazinamidase [Planctomycetaceae bacterium]|nr:nicotinamidase/pyrazinamidase [Planctomycetaceae bacterium]MBP63542.1 nicotinamidase/pyrazinamidase [Planctomycetaceae bacterium]